MSRSDDELEKLNADEKALGQRKARADRAADILDDDLFKGAVKAVRDKLVADMTTGDPDNLAHARMRYDCLEMVVSALCEHLRDGQIVKAKLGEIETRRTWLQRWRAA